MNFAKTQTKANLSRIGIAAALGLAILAGTSAAADHHKHRNKGFVDKTKHVQKVRTTHKVKNVHHHYHAKDWRHKNRPGWRFKHTHNNHRDYRCNTYRPVAPRRHWVPGYWTKQYIPPVYRYRYDACGTRHRITVRAGFHKRVWVHGRWTTTHRNHYRGYH
ncbi:MAG: hypothetical protein AAF750_07095 [Planctomycetota bacterium]